MSVTLKTRDQNVNRGDWLEIVRQHVGSLRYGVVEIIVHEAKVTQIEKTERLRLDKPASETHSHRLKKQKKHYLAGG